VLGIQVEILDLNPGVNRSCMYYITKFPQQPYQVSLETNGAMTDSQHHPSHQHGNSRRAETAPDRDLGEG
jgi:hypothetical protein